MAFSEMLNGALWASALAAAVWVALRMTPRRALGASARYGLWWMVMAAALALPLASMRPALSPRGLVREIDAPAIRVPQVERMPTPQASEPRWHRLTVTPGRWPEVVGWIWVVVATLLLLRLALSFAAIDRARRRAQPVPEPWTSKPAEWLAAMGASGRTIGIAASRDISIPAAAGPARAAILIPARLFELADEGDIERIGLHEAAHFARRDDWALPGQRILEAALWIYPAARLIARELDMEREIACDDRVVAATGEPRAYAACLTRMIELCGAASSAPVPTMADRPSRIARRIELVLAGGAAGSRAGFYAATIALAFAAVAFASAPTIIDFAAPPAIPALTLIEQHAEPITVLEAIQQAPVARAARRMPRSAAGLAPAILAAAEPLPQSTPAPAQRIAFYFDLSALDASQLATSVKAAHQFVPTRTNALFSVFAFDGSSVRVLQDFTNSTSLIDGALDQLKAIGGSPVFARTPAEGLTDAVNRLGAIEGKKALVYMTAPPADRTNTAAWRGVIDAAVRANVAFFPIDVR